MTLVEIAPSDDLRLIVHRESDRRAPFDAATNHIRACDRAVARAVAGWRDLFGDASGGDVSITASHPPPPAEDTAPVRDRHIVPATSYCIAKGVDQMKPLTFLMMCTSAGASVTLLAGASAAATTQPGQTTTIVGERVIAEAGPSVRVPYQ